MAAIAETAVNLIRRRAKDNDQFPPQDIQTPFTLEIRESTTGSAPKSSARR
jgi:hypothetical protein